MADKAEKELQRLRRLPENKICPNCQRKDTLFGFSAVCWQFKTFVCGECKSAHQSFSHRCKSVTMSNWTMDEVRQLDERNGGGNRLAHERWVAGAPESAWPGESCSQDTLKRFIDRAYNQKAWERPAGESRGNSCASQEPEEPRSARRAAAPESARPSLPPPDRTRASVAPALAPAPVPAASVNLLDDMFGDAPAPATPAAAPAAPSAAPAVGGFAQFGIGPSSAAAPAAASAAAAFDPSATPAGPAVAAPAAAADTTFGAFDPFALPAAQQAMPQQATPQQQPQQQQLSAFPFTNGTSGLPGMQGQAQMPQQQQLQQLQQQQQQSQAQCDPFNMGGPSAASGMQPQQPQQMQPHAQPMTMGGGLSAFSFVSYSGASAGTAVGSGMGISPSASPWSAQGSCMQMPNAFNNGGAASHMQMPAAFGAAGAWQQPQQAPQPQQLQQQAAQQRAAAAPFSAFGGTGSGGMFGTGAPVGAMPAGSMAAMQAAAQVAQQSPSPSPRDVTDMFDPLAPVTTASLNSVVGPVRA